MIARIEETTMTVFEMTGAHETTGHAALALAKQRIEEGTAQEQVNAH